MVEPLCVLVFAVREPISCINHGYRPFMDGKGKMQFAGREELKAFKKRVRDAAWLARAGSDWPMHLDVPKVVKVSYELYDVGLDSDSPRKGIRDGMEGVLYANDRVVMDGPAWLPKKDGNGRRAVVRVELLEIRTMTEAERLKKEREARRVKSALKKASRAPSKPESKVRGLSLRCACGASIKGRSNALDMDDLAKLWSRSHVGVGHSIQKLG